MASYYKEISKACRIDGSFTTSTVVSENFKTKDFLSTSVPNREGSSTITSIKFEKRDHSAGVDIEITSTSKVRRSMQFGSLGRTEIEMLISFLQSLELKDYNGTFIPTNLTDLTK